MVSEYNVLSTVYFNQLLKQARQWVGSSVKKSVTLLCTDTFGLPTQSRGRKNLPLFNQGAIFTIIT